MAKITEARKDRREVGNPTEPELRAAMGKAIREIKRRAKSQNIKLVVANKKSWDCPEIASYSFSPISTATSPSPRACTSSARHVTRGFAA